MQSLVYALLALILLTPFSKADVNKILRDMKSTNTSTLLRAYRDIASEPVVQSKRIIVAQALCDGLKRGDRKFYSLIEKAFEQWNSPAVNKTLVGIIKSNKDRILLNAAFKGLAYSAGPDEIEFMVQHMLKGKLSPAMKGLKIIGARAEPALLASLQGISGKPPTDLLRILGDVGTKKSIPALQKVDSIFARKAIKDINNRGEVAPAPDPDSPSERGKRAMEIARKRAEEAQKNQTKPGVPANSPFIYDRPGGLLRDWTTPMLMNALHGTNYSTAKAAAIKLQSRFHPYEKKYVDKIASGLNRGYKYARHDSDRKPFLETMGKWKNKSCLPFIHDGLKSKGSIVNIVAIKAAAGFDSLETMRLVCAHVEQFGIHVGNTLAESGKAGETLALELLKKGHGRTAGTALSKVGTERAITPITEFLAKNPNSSGKYTLQAALRDIKKRLAKK